MSDVQFTERMKATAAAHAAVDFEKMYELAKHLHESTDAREAFAKDPEGFAFRFNGYRPQDGHHLHMADEHNNMIPAEDHGVFGSDERPMWGRTEIRVGYKTTALVECA